MLPQADMSMAVKVWSHMREQGVQPLEEEYLLMIQGWAQSGELWDRVRDGSVERFLQELCDSGFELCPVDGVEPGTVCVVDASRTNTYNFVGAVGSVRARCHTAQQRHSWYSFLASLLTPKRVR